jgi:hypothetical protein
MGNKFIGYGGRNLLHKSEEGGGGSGLFEENYFKSIGRGLDRKTLAIIGISIELCNILQVDCLKYCQNNTDNVCGLKFNDYFCTRVQKKGCLLNQSIEEKECEKTQKKVLVTSKIDCRFAALLTKRKG